MYGIISPLLRWQIGVSGCRILPLTVSTLEEVTITQMQSARGGHSPIYKMLHGYISRGYQYSGLREKCPAISFHDLTMTTSDEGLL